jgi:hypothetical protein
MLKYNKKIKEKNIIKKEILRCVGVRFLESNSKRTGSAVYLLLDSSPLPESQWENLILTSSPTTQTWIQ